MIFLSVAVHVAAIGALLRLPDPPVVDWTPEEVALLAILHDELAPEPPPAAPVGEGRASGPSEPAPAPPVAATIPVEAPDEIPPVEAKLAMIAPEPIAPALAGASVGEGGGLTVDTIAVYEGLRLPFEVQPGERFRLPRLRNRELIISILTRLYPRRLAYRGLPSAATIRLAIDERGRVDPNSVRVIAYDREEFAFIVMDVARRFRFTPARYRNEDVPIVIDIPVQWVAAP
jgi:hypothetical protein